MTIEEIVIREEGQTFDCKSIQISPKALAIPVVAFANADPEIAAFLKTYKYVKEFGEGVDRMSRELEANGTAPLSFHLDDFILKITVPRSNAIAEKVAENAGIKVAETSKKVTENRTEKVTVNAGAKVTVNRTENVQPTEIHQGLIEKLIERASLNGDKLSKNRIAILTLMIDNPYITKRELAEAIGIREISIWRNIEAMRGKYLRRVGSNKSGFGEMIIDDRTEKVTIKVTKNRTETEQKPNRNRTEKEVTLTEVRAAILRLIKDDPYISKAELAKEIGVHPSVISRNIEALRGKYLRRVGPDKGGFWEIIKWAQP